MRANLEEFAIYMHSRLIVAACNLVNQLPYLFAHFEDAYTIYYSFIRISENNEKKNDANIIHENYEYIDATTFNTSAFTRIYICTNHTTKTNNYIFQGVFNL